jgi:antitoxin component of MazEF toxin-antitoxin module
VTIDPPITVRAQVTLPRLVLDHLGVRPGERIRVALLAGGRVELRRVAGGGKLSRLAGALHRAGQRTVTLEEMQQAIEDQAAEADRRSKESGRIFEIRLSDPDPPQVARAMDRWLEARRDQRKAVEITSVELLDLIYESDE